MSQFGNIHELYVPFFSRQKETLSYIYYKYSMFHTLMKLAKIGYSEVQILLIG